MFSYNKHGNITFNGEAFTHSSLGASDEGQRRAARFAQWLNECLRKARGEWTDTPSLARKDAKVQEDEDDIICSCGHKARFHSDFWDRCGQCDCMKSGSEVIAAYKQALT